MRTLEELVALRKRAQTALSFGTELAHATTHLISLLDEMISLREKAKSARLVAKGDMVVETTQEAPKPEPSKEVAPAKKAEEPKPVSKPEEPPAPKAEEPKVQETRPAARTPARAAVKTEETKLRARSNER